jgi:small-conductance mechanosensitive channel
MRIWLIGIRRRLSGRVIVLFAVGLLAAGPANIAWAATAVDPDSTGLVDRILAQLEDEAETDAHAASAIPAALEREWRSFDLNGSAIGALADLGWVVLATIVALFAQRTVAGVMSQRPRRKMRERSDGPTLLDLLRLLFCDFVGLAIFLAVMAAALRHWLPGAGASASLTQLTAGVLIRWRIASLIVGAVLRPNEPIARLIDLPDDRSHHLARFLSALVFLVIVLIGLGRLALADEDSGAAHDISLIIALLVVGLYALAAVHSRAAGEALIRGSRREGAIADIRGKLARAWVPISLTVIAGMFLVFVAGLSLGLLSYSRALNSTLGVLLVLIILERLTERAWHEAAPTAISGARRVNGPAAQTTHRILRAIVVVIAILRLTWIWIDAIELKAAEAIGMVHSAEVAAGTLMVAYIVWELVRLSIDRQLQATGGGPSLPGDDDDAAAPASRLQTVLPLLRAAIAVMIAILAVLIALSHLGINTAPLIAGASIFGLAVSFGSQALVRDVISGLFYIWDDAFRVGEYIDTGRLKGTVEALGIRSVRVRHQNGPLHTIPYGQLGAVTNMSRDFATIKFNLRFDPATDIELVRRTAKQIGAAMQDEPAMAAEIMIPLKLQGVAEIVDNAIVLRFKFTARPIMPSWVQREYMKRMVKVFAEKGITFASGAMMVLHTVPTPEATSVGPTEPAIGVVEGTIVAAAAGAV